MHPLPHRYSLSAQSSAADEDLALQGAGLPELSVSPPQQFGGSPDGWSPESLLAGAVASCFVLSFRALASARKLEWRQLKVDIAAILDREDKKMLFTEFTLDVVLTVGNSTDPERANDLLVQAKHSCLVSNSLATPVHLNTHVEFSS